MKRFTRAVVRLRIPILILSVLLLGLSVVGIVNTRINYDILYYLPKDLDTMKGQDILMEDFEKGAYAIFICEDMTRKDALAMKQKVEAVDHVDTVLWYDTLVDESVPLELLPDSVGQIFTSEDGSGTLMFIFFDDTTSAEVTMTAVDEIRDMAGKQCFMAGMTTIVNDMKLLIEEEMAGYIIISAILAIIVLSISQDSFLVPVLMLLNIGLAILYNLGTNFLQGQISFLTMSLVAVLQLGVTMDYSIFLYSSFKEQKALCEDKREAMARAIEATVVSITGSSLTTIAGFIALCFMSFTLGLDLGIVMAKGVVMGVITCVTILPSLLLVCDGAITKTSHRPLDLKGGGITAFVIKHYKAMALLMVLLWIPALYGNEKYEVYYKLDDSLPEHMGCVQASKELTRFDMSSIAMVLTDASLDPKETRAMTEELKNVDGINFCIGLDSLAGPLLPREMIPQAARELLESDNWKMLMISSDYEIATDEVNAQCDAIQEIIKRYDDKAMLVGETACTKDLIDITDHDFKVVSAVSIGAIFLLILLVLKSVSLPLILVLVIELAIYLNMGLSFYTGQVLPFIASMSVGTIQLGATVDYAILMTNRYKVERIAGHDKREATRIALETSMHSILTSAVGFFAATVGVGIYSSCDMVGCLCILLGRGALISMVVVILMLPSMYMLFDGLICRTTLGMKDCL